MTNSRKLTYLLVLFLVNVVFGVSLVFAQSQITFRQLSVKDGLSQNSAISITQDSTGYLWIATQDGLNKYDGNTFTRFPYSFVDITKQNYSHLGQVYTDRQGSLWIVPLDKLLYKLNITTQKFEPLKGAKNISQIYQDEDFNIWLATYGDGLLLINPETKMASKIVIPEVRGTIFRISEDSNKKGTLLLSTEKGIIEFQHKTGKSEYLDLDTSFGNTVDVAFSDLVIDGTGRQWIGTFGDGLYFRESNTQNLSRASSLALSGSVPLDLNILDLFIDSKDRLWVATYGRGLYMLNFREQKVVNFDVEEYNSRALHYKDVLCIYEDYSGTLWFGTDGAGLSYYDEYLEKFNSLTKYQTPKDIQIDVVRSIVVDKNDAIWIGTSGKGLTQFEPAINSWRTFKSNLGNEFAISSDRVMSLFVEEDNDLWIGTQGGGLGIMDGKEQLIHFSPSSSPKLSANTIWTIYKNSEASVWLGTRENGIIEFDKKKGEIHKYVAGEDNERGPPSNNIRVITGDNSGNLWIGTEADGFAFFDVKKELFTVYDHSPDSNSISNNGIKSLYHDPKGILWIGTNGGGLNAFDLENNYFYTYTIENGLANNVIYAILPDEDGNLWLSSNKGITRFTPPKNFEANPDIVNFDNYDGLATEFNTGAYHKDKKGRLYFGGLDGIYWFKPDEIKENTILPKTTITGLEIVDEPYPMSENMRLGHEKNTLTFTFSSLQFALPEKTRYQYKLLNYDKGWIQADNVNFARYSQLPPGHYEFQVKSSNYDGVWNEHSASYGFSIKPPWYLTNLAKAVYALLFILAVYGVYSYLKWRWRMRLNLKLREDEALRLKMLNDFKSKLYTDISHEFRTPLTLIAGPVDAKLAEGRLNDADFSNFSMIKRNTNRLIHLVDQLLHLAKLEKGKLRLRVLKGNLGLFLKALATSFEYPAKRKRMDYEVRVEDLDDKWYDEDALEKIVTNLLSNAFKYSPDGGKCLFTVFNKDERLVLSVRNTVKIPEDIEVEKLFSRFYQKNEYAEGAGVGLALVKELVRLYQGSISVGIEEGHLIHFQIDLPMKKELFENSKNIEVQEKLRPIPDVIAGTIDAQPEVFDADIEGRTPGLPLVLIVEDHDEVREFLKAVWKNRYQMFEAVNGKEGITKALEIIPDLIITDIRMPICDGITLCNTLKIDERTSHIPIILLTAGMDEEQELKGLQSGADDYVTKPFKIRILERRVQNLIDTRRALRNRYSQEFVLKAKDIAITPTDENFLNRLQEVLDDHLTETDFDAKKFSGYIGMSRMQLHRKLLAFTGLSTTAFIRSQRLKQATEILKTSDASINEVAYAVGFNTPSYFIKCFKEIYKKTPSEYLQTTDK